jgi:hypothetical protein
MELARVISCAAVWIGLLAPTLRGAELNIPPTIPDGLGVNIHFTDPQPGEMRMLSAAGFTFVRMDFDWARIEKQKGVYDFAPYERLLKELDAHGLRALFILDYANPLYDDNRSPDTDEGRAAFARWAAAGAKHFKGRGVLWEMYNEPNIAPFWRPKPNTDDYVKLALETGKAIREAASGEIYVGPACSGVDLPFLESCFKAGLLEYWDAVTVHPYRQTDPETVEDDYRNLRLLIAKYAPPGKKIPILSGEWGYSAVWSGFDEDRQGKMLARQWLINLSQDVRLSIWYDWHDDGPDPKEPEHHFGTVRHEHHKDRVPVYDAKPVYLAAKTLAGELRGFRFNKRLALGSADDYMLLFERDGEVKVVAWTRSREPKKVVLPASAGRFDVTSHVGEKRDAARSTRSGLAIELTDAPVYLTPREPNDLLRLAAGWERVPHEILAPAPAQNEIRLTLANPLEEDVPVRVEWPRAQSGTVRGGASESFAMWFGASRFDGAKRRTMTWEFGGHGKLSQETFVIPAGAMSVTILPRCGRYLPLRVENPSGNAFHGSVGIDYSGGAIGAVDALHLPENQRELTLLRSAPPTPADAEYRVAVAVAEDGAAEPYVVRARFRPIVPEESGLELRAEGDAKVASEQSFKIVAAPDGLPAPGARAVRVDYRFDAGWKYVCLSPKPDPMPVEGKPAQLGLWVKGDGSGNIPRMRFVDSTGQTFQPDAGKLTYTDWRYVTFPLDGTKAGHWGGAKDGVVHYPIKLETILLIDNADRQKTSGTVHVSSPTLVYHD